MVADLSPVILRWLLRHSARLTEFASELKRIARQTPGSDCKHHRQPLNCSFTPSGEWFVFAEDTGETIKTGFRSKSRAVAFIALQLWGTK